jgi:integrase
MPILKLSSAFLASGLVCPPGLRRIEFCDSVVPGLLIEKRTATDSMPTWYWRRKVNGKTAYKNLGPLKDMDLDSARKTVTLLKAEHALAPKPSLNVKLEKGAMTLDAFMKYHYFPHAEMHKRSHKRDDQLYRIRIAPRFGHLQLREISRHQVQAFHIDLVREEGLSHSSSDLHVALFRHALALAVEWEMLERNVLKGFKLYLVNNRVDNFLVEEEVERLKEVLLSDNNRPVCMALLWLLVTGARLASGLHCRWKDIDMANEVWLVPATDAKSKKPNPHYLNSSALWILRQQAGKSESEYVFANPATGKPYTTITRVWWRLREKSKINTRARIHDLRHTWAHRVLAAGHSITELQFGLHHADPRTTMLYSHASPNMMRQVASSAALRLQAPGESLVIEAT